MGESEEHWLDSFWLLSDTNWMCFSCVVDIYGIGKWLEDDMSFKTLPRKRKLTQNDRMTSDQLMYNKIFACIWKARLEKALI